MTKYISIRDMAKRLGVSISTLRRWDEEGRGPKSIRTRGGQRRYEVVGTKEAPSKRITIAYARVSSQDQKEDLKRRKRFMIRRLPPDRIFCNVKTSIEAD